MFLCVSSADNRNEQDVDDFASVFQTTLQEPILLKDFTIELVSAIITLKKNIKITDVNCKITIRIGDDSVAEQYFVRITPGTYTPDEFCKILENKILDVIPVKGWVQNTAGDKFVSCVYDKSGSPHKFVLTFNKLAPNNQEIAQYMTDDNLNTFGFDLEYGSSSAVKQHIKFINNDTKQKNNEPIFSQKVSDLDTPNQSGSLVGLDVGEAINVDENDPAESSTALGYAGWSNCGIAENGGKFEVTIRPQRCSINTNYNHNIGSNESNTAPYFKITDNTRNTPYDSYSWEKALLNPNSKTNIRTDINGVNYVSGILLAQSNLVRADITQGLPYSRFPAIMAFPPNDSGGINPADGTLTTNAYRQEKITSTWNNSYRMVGNTQQNQGPDNNISSYNHFDDRGFNLEIDETDPTNPTNPNSKSNSSLALFKNPTDDSFDLYEKEPLTIELANAPLIQGLLKTNVTGVVAQSYIKKGGDSQEDIIVNYAPTTFVMNYKLNAVGQFNSQSFGVGSTRVNGSTSGGASRRLPYYKITKLDANNQPEIVVIVDGGENIVAGQELVMNDPNTFDIIANPNNITEKEIVDGFCAVVTPNAINIGATIDKYTTRFQYLPTTISLANDMIFGAGTGLNNIVESKLSFVEGQKLPLTSDFSKDIQLSVIPLNSAVSASDQPNSVRFQVKGFTPEASTFGTEHEMYEQFCTDPETTLDMEEVFFEASPENWNSSVTYDSGSRTLTDWTNFKQDSAASRIKLTLELNNYFEFSATCSYLNTSTSSFEGESTLINTFESATINGITFPKFECTSKTRLFPYHIGISTSPGTNYTNPLCQGDNEIIIEGSRLADYKLSPNDSKSGISHYERNLRNLQENTTQYPDIFVFPVDQTAIGGGALDKPPVMLKFGDDIIPTSSPALATPNQLPADDIAPTGTNYISFNTGFQNSYIANTAEWATNNLTIEGKGPPRDIPAVNTFAVELENVNAKGYITQAYTNQGIKKGRGISSSIIAVVPRLELRGSEVEEEYVKLGYSTPYSQPVKISLPKKEFIYNFDFRLRDITDNTYLKNLLNPTELIFRIENKSPELLNE